MATPQYLYEDTAPVMAPVATAKAVDAGDIVGIDTGTLVRAEDETWDTDLATTQENFIAKYLGIAAQSKTATQARVWGNSEDNLIRVDTAGMFEMDCASASFDIGDFVGPAKDTGNALLSDKVVEVATAARAVGRVVEKQASVTRVKFRVLSTLAPLAK